MKGGAKFEDFPIIKVVPVEGKKEKYESNAGAHRILAAQECGLTEIEVEVLHGNEEDLYLESVRDNLKHGLPYTSAENDKIIRTLRSKFDMSCRDIAEVVGRSKSYVAKVCSGDLNGFTKKSIDFLKENLLEADKKTVSTLVEFVNEIKKILHSCGKDDDFVAGLSECWDRYAEEPEEDPVEDEDLDDDPQESTRPPKQSRRRQAKDDPDDDEKFSVDSFDEEDIEEEDYGVEEYCDEYSEDDDYECH